MKKTLTITLLAFSFLLSAQSAQACSLAAGSTLPNINEVIKNKDVNIFVVKAMADGPLVVAKTIMYKNVLPQYIVLDLPGDSCRDRHDDFEKGDFFVVLAPTANQHVVTFSSLDSQFTFAAKNEADAMSIYQNLEKLLPRFSTSELEQNKEYKAFGSTLRPDMKQKEVAYLQQAIKKALSDDSITIDGSYGPATFSAVKRYQESRGLFADGLAGVKTQKALEEKLPAKTGTSDPVSETKTETVITEKKPDTTTGVVEEKVKPSVSDSNIVALLKKAKSDIESFKKKNNSYLNANEVIISFNNKILLESKATDPLFKSSNGGEHFIYLAKLSTNKIACVDDTSNTEYVEISSLPNFDKEILSCV